MRCSNSQAYSGVLRWYPSSLLASPWSEHGAHGWSQLETASERAKIVHKPMPTGQRNLQHTVVVSSRLQAEQRSRMDANRLTASPAQLCQQDKTTGETARRQRDREHECQQAASISLTPQRRTQLKPDKRRDELVVEAAGACLALLRCAGDGARAAGPLGRVRPDRLPASQAS